VSDKDTWSTGLIVEDRRPAVPDYKDTKRDEMLESTALVLKHLGVDSSKRGVKIELGGTLCAVSGIGASAANCVALARALSDAIGKPLTEDQVNAAAYEGEKGYHGTSHSCD
jgi:mevalonate kinase